MLELFGRRRVLVLRSSSLVLRKTEALLSQELRVLFEEPLGKESQVLLHFVKGSFGELVLLELVFEVLFWPAEFLAVDVMADVPRERTKGFLFDQAV